MQSKKSLLNIGKSLPVKTRIAVWFMYFTAFMWFTFLLCSGALNGFRWGDSGSWDFIVLLLYIGPYVLAAYLATLKNKSAYIAASLILILYLFFLNWPLIGNWSLTVGSGTYYYLMASNVLILIPAILIVLDANSHLKTAMFQLAGAEIKLNISLAVFLIGCALLIAALVIHNYSGLIQILLGSFGVMFAILVAIGVLSRGKERWTALCFASILLLGFSAVDFGSIGTLTMLPGVVLLAISILKLMNNRTKPSKRDTIT